MTKAAFGAILLCATLAVFSSCKKDKYDESKAVIEEYEELPVTDQLDVTTDAKAVVLGSDRSDFCASVVNRLKNVTEEISADAEIIVFTSGYVMKFTKEQVTMLLQAYAGGASFVFINPTFPKMIDFEHAVNNAFSLLVLNGIPFDREAAVSFVEKIQAVKDLYDSRSCGGVEGAAFRGSSIYMVRDLDEMAEYSEEHTYGYSSDGTDSQVDRCANTEYTPNEYDHGKSADLLVRWINDAKNETRAGFGLKSEASDAIDKYMTGQRISIQHKVGPSRALDRTLVYEMVYTVYSAYDFDKDEDYYFIRLEPNFHCSDLGCKNGSETWVEVSKEVKFDDGSTSGHWWSWRSNKWYGPYMSKFDYTAHIVQENGDPVNNTTLLATSPKTDVSGTTGYSTGLSWSLSGNIGFNSGGLMGGVTGGFTFTETHSQSTNSLRVYHKMLNNIPNWRVEGIVPQFHPGWNPYHDEVATFQKSDWQTEFTWIVKVPKPQRDKPYYIKADDITEITELNYSYYDLELRVHPTQSAMIKLSTPNRSNESFTMTCSDIKLRDEIAKQFSKNWQSQFTYYATDADASTAGAKTMFEKVKVAVNGYAETLKANGFTGTYTFSLNKTDGTKLASFTLDNGVVK